jgi:hypothetical protein
MIIQMDDYDGESVTKICKGDSWMDVIETVAEGLRGFGYAIPCDRQKFLAMLDANMEANE